MLCTQFIQNGRAGSRLVANGSVTDGGFVLSHKICRETMGESREGLRQPQTTDFPVAGGGVLACTSFNGSTVTAHCIGISRITCRRNLPKTQLGHVGQAGVTLCHHMGNGGSTYIAIFICVRQVACAYAVKHGKKNTSHPSISSYVLFYGSARYRDCNPYNP